MELIIEERAHQWFMEEIGFKEGDGIRFKTRIYGSSPVNDTFALAIDPNQPVDPIAQFQSSDGILYFVEKEDQWFFQGHDLIVSYNQELDEPLYIYRKDGVDKK